jgi:prepilin-type N-terminal cleavage/methylation domain-containing protein
MNRQLGFNIIELMVAIAVLGVLMGVGVPAMQELIQNNRLTTQINLLSTSLALARSEAIKLNERVVVCASSNGTDCANGITWDRGWVIFVDRVVNPTAGVEIDLGPPGTDNCAVDSATDCILNLQAAYPGTNRLTPGADAPDFVAYVGDGSVRCNTTGDISQLESCSNAATFFTLCDFRDIDRDPPGPPEYAKALAISRTGRVSMLTKKPNGDDLECQP